MIRFTSVEQQNPILINPFYIVAIWRNGYNGSRIRTREGQIFDVSDSIDTVERKLRTVTQ